MRLRRPSWAVQAAIRTWIRRGKIDMTQFEDRRFESVEDFFLRGLKPGARSLGRGVVSPVDGFLVSRGTIDRERTLVIKKEPLRIRRLVNGRHHDLSVDEYDGGRYAVIFLSPSGYHRIHAPVDAELVDCRWIPGRYFPQNEKALRHISGVYERNERLTLQFRREDGSHFLAILVGASLIGGIQLEGIPRSRWLRPEAVTIGRRYRKGEEVGHFRFGSTVVLLMPRGISESSASPFGSSLSMGETLWES